jgi:mannose-6-phosphate isomerase-like protein (cupin superfamily)
VLHRHLLRAVRTSLTLLAFSTPLGAQASGAADGVAHWHSAALDSVAMTLGPASIAAELGPVRPFLHLLLRRTEAGEAELHESEVDLVQVRSGRAQVITGGALRGERRMLSPGEWRAPSIDGGGSRMVGPGDVLVIPAGVPHRWVPVGPEPFVYLVVKVPGS